MPGEKKVLRRIELTSSEREGLNLNNYYAESRKFVPVSEVLKSRQENIYAKQDQVYEKNSISDRTETIVYGRSNAHSRVGETISFNNGGSGHHFLMNRHKMSSSKENIFVDVEGEGRRVLSEKDPEYHAELEKFAGPRRAVEGKIHDYVRAKVVKGPTFSKVKLSFAGPLKAGGASNRGEYSIENLTDYYVKIGLEEVDRVLREETNEQKAAKKPIHLDFLGHSRGAVTALEGAMALNYALKKKYPSEVYDRFHFDIMQYDPVPGLGSRDDYRAETQIIDETQDPDKVKRAGYLGFKPEQVNSTVVYSIQQQHWGVLFQPQLVLGANRVIFVPADHDVNMGMMEQYRTWDEEKHEFKDSESYRVGYKDLTTGQKYRGSGLTGLRDGIFVADEMNNLHQVQSAEELENILTAVQVKSGMQKGRSTGFVEIAQQWFDKHQNVQQAAPAENERQGEMTDRERENLLIDLYVKGKMQDLVSGRMPAKNKPLTVEVPGGTPAILKAAVVKKAFAANIREDRSRRAMKTIFVVEARAKAAVERTAGDGTVTQLHLEGLSEKTEQLLFEHGEGKFDDNKVFADQFNRATDEERKVMIKEKLLKNIMACQPAVTKASRTDEEQVVDYEATYEMLVNFSNFTDAQKDLQEAGCTFGKEVDEEIARFGKAFESKFKENSLQMSLISDRCYKDLDLTHADALPEADRKDMKCADPRIASYLEKAGKLNAQRQQNAGINVSGARANEKKEAKSLIDLGKKVKDWHLFKRSSCKGMLDSLTEVMKAMDQAGKTGSDKDRKALEKAYHESIRQAVLYKMKAYQAKPRENKFFGKSEQERINFADQLIRFSQEKIEVMRRENELTAAGPGKKIQIRQAEATPVKE